MEPTHLVVQLEAGEHGVLEADVHAHEVGDDGVRLVGLEGRGDGQPSGRVPVEDVDQLLLLHCPCGGGGRGRKE